MLCFHVVHLVTHRTDFRNGVVWWQDYDISKRRGSHHINIQHTQPACALSVYTCDCIQSRPRRIAIHRQPPNGPIVHQSSEEDEEGRILVIYIYIYILPVYRLIEFVVLHILISVVV